MTPARSLGYRLLSGGYLLSGLQTRSAMGTSNSFQRNARETKRAFLGCNGRGRGCFCPLHPVNTSCQKENNKSNNEEINHAVNKCAVIDGYRSRLLSYL